MSYNLNLFILFDFCKAFSSTSYNILMNRLVNCDLKKLLWEGAGGQVCLDNCIHRVISS